MLLSVIIPVYNIECYITKCIESILAQNIDAMEILLIDDGSTDQSGIICDSMASSDMRISVIHKTNGGVSAARNTGLDLAKGQYITMVDGDDFLLPGTFGPALSFMEEHPDTDILQFPAITVEDNGYRRQRAGYPKETKELRGTQEIMEALLGSAELFPGYLWGKIYRKRVWEGLRLREDMELNEDAYVFPFMLSHSRSVVFSPTGGYCYVMRNGSATHSNRKSTPKNRLDYFRFTSLYYETALTHQVNTAYWWNKSCLAAIGAWTYWDTSDEIKQFLKRLHQTKRLAKKDSASTKPIHGTRWFSPLFIARINRILRPRHFLSTIHCLFRISSAGSK